MNERHDAKEPTVQSAQEVQEANNQHAFVAGAASQHHAGEEQPSAQHGVGGDAGGRRQSYSGGLHGYTNNSVLPSNNRYKYAHNNLSIGAIDQHFERLEDEKYSIQALKAIPGNSKCFDCAVDDPQWVNVNYAIILCAECAEIHQEHSLNIVPFADGYLTKEHRMLLSSAGNKIASYYWMANWGQEYSEYLKADSSPEERRQYIVEKYCGKWVSIAEKAKIAAAFNNTFYTHTAGSQQQISGTYVNQPPKQVAQQFPLQFLYTIPIAPPSDGTPNYVINNMTYRPRKINGKKH